MTSRKRRRSKADLPLKPTQPVNLPDYASVVVHRFGHGCRTCHCGQMSVPVPLPPSYTRRPPRRMQPTKVAAAAPAAQGPEAAAQDADDAEASLDDMVHPDD